MALLSRKWKACPCRFRKCSDRSVNRKACIGKKVNFLVSITITCLNWRQRVQVENQKYGSCCLPLLPFVFTKCLADEIVESVACISLRSQDRRLKLGDEDFSSWIAWDLKTTWANNRKNLDTAIVLYSRLQQNFPYNRGVIWRRHGVSWSTIYIPFLLKGDMSSCSYCSIANFLQWMSRKSVENISVHQLKFWCFGVGSFVCVFPPPSSPLFLLLLLLFLFSLP